MYGLKNAVALLSGLLLLFQSVAGAAILAHLQDQIIPRFCTPISPSGFPLKDDCAAALAKIAPIKPRICTEQFQTEFDLVTVGTCRIRTFSYTSGKAHCLDGGLIITAGNAILAGCTFENYTGGQYEWLLNSDGVRFVKA
ncbi:hypothetical protein EV426DRAFT_570534 [Tirmania nivea]|nr:hypothetical protein EV426DRAFT_570534 [Tirmania nivea]